MKDRSFLEELEIRLNLLDEEINSAIDQNSKFSQVPEIKEMLYKINEDVKSHNEKNNIGKAEMNGITEPVNRLMDY